MKENPSNEQVYKFLDVIKRVFVASDFPLMMEVQFDIPEYIAEDFVKAWQLDRSI